MTTHERDECVIRPGRKFGRWSFREADVRDVAREVLRTARLYRSPVALFVFPDNRAEYMLKRGAMFARVIAEAPESLVGCYTEETSVDEIVEDVLAMPRGAQ